MSPEKRNAGGRARARPRAKSRRRKRRALLLWWPFMLAVVATPFAVRAASVLALSGPGALRLLYPFVVLVQAHAPGHLAAEQRDALAEWTMWAQFPVYGLLAALVGRRRGILTGLLAVLAVHSAGVLAAILLKP